MPEKQKQFFQNPAPGAAAAKLPGAAIAIYEFPGKNKNGEAITMAVECVEGGSNLPQNATSLRTVARKLDLGEELEAVTAMAQITLDKLKALKPGEMKIEFGVELGGEFGVPMLTKGEAKANFKITLKWKDK